MEYSFAGQLNVQGSMGHEIEGNAAVGDFYSEASG